MHAAVAELETAPLDQARDILRRTFGHAEFDARLEALAAEILANSWFSHRANKKLLRETDGLSLEAGLAHEVYRGEGRGPDMAERIAGFQNKTVKQA